VVTTVLPPPLASRLWRGFGSTAWWRLIVGGLLVIVATFLLMLPFDSIRMANKIRSDVGKEALKTSFQREYFERARGGLLVVRSLAGDHETSAEIDSAIAEIDHEISKPLLEPFEGSVEELRVEIAKLRTEADSKTSELVALTQKITKGEAVDADAAGERLAELATEIAEGTVRLSQLQRQLKAKLGDKSGTGVSRDSKIVIDIFGKKEAIIVDLNESKVKNGKPVAPQAPASPAAPTFPVAPLPPVPPKTLSALATLSAPNAEPSVQVISETINRDAAKFIYAGFATLLLIVLFTFMLIARAFAGRAARGEQRAVIAESRERTESHARQLAEAKLTLMRAQVEPHFLFNTLAHVQALQEIDPPQAGTMLERLISYLRAAMRENTSTLGREIEVVRAYLDLLKIRMGERLRYVINVPAELNNVALPPTMIATLVENAIKHGLEPKKEGGTVAINVRLLPGDSVDAERLEVLVADDGLGLGGAQTAGTGVGLINTRERLKMLYGSAGELVVEPNAPSGVRALMRVPTTVSESMHDMGDDYAADSARAGISKYTMQTVGLLALFAGWLGVHRFYVGHKRTGTLQAVLGILSVISGLVPVFSLPLLMWVVLDIVRIITREFTDGRGLRVAQLDANDTRVYAGSRVPPKVRESSASPKSRSIAMILVLLLGLIGAHRFYVGRVGSGLAMLFTLGGLGLWWLIDLVIVASGQLKDDEGKWVSEWE
jgi:TM2 domain-containing membrane protein YozV